MRADRSPPGVSLANWQDPPFNRWAFLHLDELLTMAPISRGGGPVRELPRDERDTCGVTFYMQVHRTAAAVVASFSTQPAPVDLQADYRQITASIALCDALATGIA